MVGSLRSPVTMEICSSCLSCMGPRPYLLSWVQQLKSKDLCCQPMFVNTFRAAGLQHPFNHRGLWTNYVDYLFWGQRMHRKLKTVSRTLSSFTFTCTFMFCCCFLRAALLAPLQAGSHPYLPVNQMLAYSSLHLLGS